MTEKSHHFSVLHYFAYIMPNVSPNAIRWNIVRVGHIYIRFAFAMSFSCCLSPFLFTLGIQRNADSGVIWALRR